MIQSFDLLPSLQLQKVKDEIGEVSNNPRGLILKAIHTTSYCGTLVNPLMASESVINRLDSTILKEFVAVSLCNSCRCF